MNFTGFAIICLVALAGYYAFAILRPDKQTNFRSEQHPFKSTEIEVEPPISVTLGMVTFYPTVQDREDNTSAISPEYTGNTSNTYDNHSPITNCSLSDLEIKVFFTREACEAGKQLFSNISI